MRRSVLSTSFWVFDWLVPLPTPLRASFSSSLSLSCFPFLVVRAARRAAARRPFSCRLELRQGRCRVGGWVHMVGYSNRQFG